MRELRGGAGERLENLDLHRCVHRVILAADDMGYGKIDIVDHRGQGIEIAAVLSHQDRVGERRRIDVLRPADEIVPAHLAMVELEAPMRPSSFAFQPGAFLIA